MMTKLEAIASTSPMTFNTKPVVNKYLIKNFDGSTVH